MTQPTVCALLLTADRQQLTDRAVRSFLSQSYERKALLIYDTGKVPYEFPQEGRYRVTLVRHTLNGAVIPIGKLRNWALRRITHATSNAAEEMAGCAQADIICHFDSDDWSAPTRIRDQVKLLEESDEDWDCVGYREMLFWDSRPRYGHVDVSSTAGPRMYAQIVINGEAWLYTNTSPKYVMETSMCYWRSAWEKTPFDECMQGEAKTFLRTRDVLGVSACEGDGRWFPISTQPLMIAELHGANTALKINADQNCVNPDGTPYWRRAPEWDARVRQILESA